MGLIDKITRLFENKEGIPAQECSQGAPGRAARDFKSIGYRMNQEEHERLESAAERAGMGLGEFMREAISDKIEITLGEI